MSILFILKFDFALTFLTVEASINNCMIRLYDQLVYTNVARNRTSALLISYYFRVIFYSSARQMLVDNWYLTRISQLASWLCCTCDRG